MPRSVAGQHLWVDAFLGRALDLTFLERVSAFDQHASDEAVELRESLGRRVDDERLQRRPLGLPLVSVQAGLHHPYDTVPSGVWSRFSTSRTPWTFRVAFSSSATRSGDSTSPRRNTTPSSALTSTCPFGTRTSLKTSLSTLAFSVASFGCGFSSSRRCFAFCVDAVRAGNGPSAGPVDLPCPAAQESGGAVDGHPPASLAVLTIEEVDESRHEGGERQRALHVISPLSAPFSPTELDGRETSPSRER